MAAEIPPYDPRWLQLESMLGGRQTMKVEPVEQSRARFEQLGAQIAQQVPPTHPKVRTKDVTLPEGLRLRIFEPVDFEQRDLPLVLYIHSGGWYAGSIEAEAHICRDIVARTPVILISPEYRLAPEHPYPHGLDDVSTVYEYIHNNASDLGGNANHKIIMGGSAGANLAACVALKYASSPTMRPSGLIVACMTSCDPSVLPAEYKARYSPQLYEDSAMLSMGLVNKAREWYQAPPQDPLYSPLLHPDLKLLPRTYITTGSKDPTHQETLFFYEECKKQGVEVDYKEWPGLPHFFWIFPGMPTTLEFMEALEAQMQILIKV